MKHGIKALACTSMLVVGLTTAPALANEIGSTEGCTPGYWKVQQHWDSWANAEASPTDLFSAKFNMGTVPTVLKGKTMVQALQGGGGAGLDGARLILARAAAAAWLNAAYDDEGHMAYPWRRYSDGLDGRPALVATVKAALNGTDRQAMTDLAARLDADNNLGCPLS